jgi:hypothetical protein
MGTCPKPNLNHTFISSLANSDEPLLDLAFTYFKTFYYLAENTRTSITKAITD